MTLRASSPDAQVEWVPSRHEQPRVGRRARGGGLRLGGHRRPPRGHPRPQAQAARLAAPGHRAARPGRGDRAHRALPRPRRPRIGSAVFIASAVLLFGGLGDLPHRHLVTAGLGVPAPLRPLEHLHPDRRLLHAVQPDAARRHRRGRAARHRVDRRRARRAVPDLLDRRPALALHADLHRPRLGRDLLHPRLLRGRHRPRPRRRHRGLRDDPRRRRALHRRWRRLRHQAPQPLAAPFGFHEVFHSFTVLAFAAHYVGVSMATYSLR